MTVDGLKSNRNFSNHITTQRRRYKHNDTSKNVPWIGFRYHKSLSKQQEPSASTSSDNDPVTGASHVASNRLDVSNVNLVDDIAMKCSESVVGLNLNQVEVRLTDSTKVSDNSSDDEEVHLTDQTGDDLPVRRCHSGHIAFESSDSLELNVDLDSAESRPMTSESSNGLDVVVGPVDHRNNDTILRFHLSKLMPSMSCNKLMTGRSRPVNDTTGHMVMSGDDALVEDCVSLIKSDLMFGMLISLMILR